MFVVTDVDDQLNEDAKVGGAWGGFSTVFPPPYYLSIESLEAGKSIINNQIDSRLPLHNYYYSRCCVVYVGFFSLYKFVGRIPNHMDL